MNTVDVIVKKREGEELTAEEIGYMVRGITEGTIPDYQVAAWLMAVFLRGLTSRETLDLTLDMARSGGPLPEREPFFLDKHSTGGVGDKATLVVAPLVASLGVPVGKMSGRGLGHTGGTIDKLDSIPGFRPVSGRREFLASLEKVGLCIAAQSPDMAPADGRIYELRDVTGTVESIPLIVSSVVSKKMSLGASAVVYDVKVGGGAFIQNVEDALYLARSMVEVSSMAGMRAEALISDMSQPLGSSVGNALEVMEAVACLKGEGPADLEEVCLDLASRMLGLAGWDPGEAPECLQEALSSGKGLEALGNMVRAQGGDESAVLEGRLPVAPLSHVVPAPSGGYLSDLKARSVGEAAMALGAGRRIKGQAIDPGVGILVLKKIGDQAEKGEPLFRILYREESSLQDSLARLNGAFQIVPDPVEAPPLLLASQTHK